MRPILLLTSPEFLYKSIVFGLASCKDPQLGDTASGFLSPHSDVIKLCLVLQHIMLRTLFAALTLPAQKYRSNSFKMSTVTNGIRNPRERW